MKKLFGVVLISLAAVLFVGCDGVHRSIYNLTPFPIQVTYSTGNIINHTVTVMRGASAISLGGMFNRIDYVSIRDSAVRTETTLQASLRAFALRSKKRIIGYTFLTDYSLASQLRKKLHRLSRRHGLLRRC